ncbi:MAG: hypothetical protein ACR2P8_10745 [Myxococcota bacterium]
MTRSDPSSSFLANLLLVLGSLLFTGLLIGLLEGTLRLLDIGPPASSRLGFQQIELPVLEPAVRADGTEVWRTRDPRHPYQSLPRATDASQLRVFTFGASATAGLGFSPNVAFSRGLERTIERAHPQLTPEVVNLGLVGISSGQVAQLVADVCRSYAPDVLVVYSGNNEFLELHAEKYAEAQATVTSRALDLLLGTRLYQVTQQVLGRGPSDPSLADRELSRDDFELARDTLLREVEVTPDEILGVIDRYEENLDEIARTAVAEGIPLVLMTVGSNWRWLGREDLPADWIDDLLGDAAPLDRARLERADRALAQELDSSVPSRRHEWLFRRAVVAEGLGDFDSARANYRAAMNEDPHLRRALDAMNERVAAVAERHGAILVDTVDHLARSAEHGIVGFDEYFDHVHLTPRGAERVAAALFDGLLTAGVVPNPDRFDPAAHLSERLTWLRDLEHDVLDVTEWLGLGFEPGQVADRDLWKYDRMVLGLDAHAEIPADRLRALVYRGNAASFRRRGGADAERDYRAALELEDDPAIRRNLDRLLARGE